MLKYIKEKRRNKKKDQGCYTSLLHKNNNYQCNMDIHILNNNTSCLEYRLQVFLEKHSPHLLYRIPYILEAYNDFPLYLFGDLDNNYNTNESTFLEKNFWNNEPIFNKKIRVRVTQDYIYRSIPSPDLIHQSEKKNYILAHNYT